MMRMSHWFPRLCLLALALTLVLSGIPALAEESEGNAPENPAVILSANPTTGYTWTATVADEKVVAVVDDGFAQDAAEETATGVGGFQRYVFEGKAEGCTTVTFTYGRSWEAEAPLYTLVYDIAVDSELQVTIVATTFTEGAIE